MGYRKFLINFGYAFRPGKPLLILRLVWTFLGIFLLRKRPLRYVDFAVGFDCNLNCEHCFATALKDDTRQRLSPGDYGKVVREAMALGAVNFSFQGGEPLLYPRLLDFIKKADPARNLISVTTNGTLLAQESILSLKNAGVDILTVSLDSGIGVEHDAFRGVSGTFEKTVKGIEIALKNGMKITLGAVVSHNNLRTEGFLRLIEMAHSLKVILFVALAAPFGNWDSREDLMLTGEDREYLQTLIDRYPFLRTDFDANYLYRGCGAVKEILYITPYGDVLACPFLHFSLGNVFEEPLKDIRERALMSRYFKDYYERCLAAEDRNFIRDYCGPFYVKGKNGVRQVHRFTKKTIENKKVDADEKRR